jgi:mono/diheme cytochrome c family protein
MPMMTGDAYLYWAVAQGGTPFGTEMPAHQDVLSEDQIWSVVRFLQAGLPQAAEAPAQ